MDGSSPSERDPRLVTWVRIAVAIGFILVFVGIVGYSVLGVGFAAEPMAADSAGVDSPQMSTNDTPDDGAAVTAAGNETPDSDDTDAIAPGEQNTSGRDSGANESGADDSSNQASPPVETANSTGENADDRPDTSAGNGDGVDEDASEDSANGESDGTGTDPAAEQESDAGPTPDRTDTGASDDPSTDSTLDGDSSRRTVTECTIIDEPGRYEITRSIGERNVQTVEIRDGFVRPVCIAIQSSDVVLEGNGNLVGGSGESRSVGVHVYDPAEATVQNVTVRNLQVEDWSNGVQVGVDSYVYDSGAPSSARIENVQSVANEGHGFFVVGPGTEFSSVTASDNGGSGIGLFDASGVHIDGATLSNNGDHGLSLFEGVFDGEYTAITARDNAGSGIFIGRDSTGNQFADLTIRDNAESAVRGYDGSDNEIDDPIVETEGTGADEPQNESSSGTTNDETDTGAGDVDGDDRDGENQSDDEDDESEGSIGANGNATDSDDDRAASELDSDDDDEVEDDDSDGDDSDADDDGDDSDADEETDDVVDLLTTLLGGS